MPIPAGDGYWPPTLAELNDPDMVTLAQLAHTALAELDDALAAASSTVGA